MAKRRGRFHRRAGWRVAGCEGKQGELGPIFTAEQIRSSTEHICLHTLIISLLLHITSKISKLPDCQGARNFVNFLLWDIVPANTHIKLGSTPNLERNDLKIGNIHVHVILHVHRLKVWNALDSADA